MEESGFFRKQAVFLHGSIYERLEDEPFSFPLHKHDASSELLLIDEGEGVFEIGGESYRVGPGTLLFYHRGVWHKEQSTAYPFRAIHIDFAGLELRGLPPCFFLDPQAPPVLPLKYLYPVIRSLMEECLDVYWKREPESATISNGLLSILFGRLAQLVYYSKQGDKPPSPSQEAVQLARRFMERNYSLPITLEMLAKEALVNKYHLAHLFKQETGMSPIQFLIAYRMEVAKHYLETTSHPVRMIGELVGYQSEQSFYKTFMNAAGVTPHQYRVGVQRQL